MAAAAHVTANVYGYVQGKPPYIGSNSGDAFSRFIPFSSPVAMSVDTNNTIFHPVTPGQQVGSSTTEYVYSVIEVPSSGLNVKSTYYAAGESVATLATSAG